MVCICCSRFCAASSTSLVSFCELSNSVFSDSTLASMAGRRARMRPTSWRTISEYSVRMVSQILFASSFPATSAVLATDMSSSAYFALSIMALLSCVGHPLPLSESLKLGLGDHELSALHVFDRLILFLVLIVDGVGMNCHIEVRADKFGLRLVLGLRCVRFAWDELVRLRLLRCDVYPRGNLGRGNLVRSAAPRQAGPPG